MKAPHLIKVDDANFGPWALLKRDHRKCFTSQTLHGFLSTSGAFDRMRLSESRIKAKAHTFFGVLVESRLT
jgi:hypothetical protein